MRIQRLEESKQDIQNFIDKFGQDTYDLFMKSKDRLKNNKLSTDITWHTKNTSPEEMDNILSTLQQKVGGNKDLSKTDFSKEQIPGKYNYLGRYGEYDVYEPLDYLSSMALGVNTGWCTTGRYGHYGEPNFKPSEEDARRHFNDYISKGIRLIYLLDPKTHYGEFAFAIYPRVLEVDEIEQTADGQRIHLTGVNFEIFDSEDLEAYWFLYDYGIPEKLISDIGLVIESEQVLDKDELPQIDPRYVVDIGLLSADQVKHFDKSILKFNHYWWVIPDDNLNCYVSEDGTLSGFEPEKRYNRNATLRPYIKVSRMDFDDQENFAVVFGYVWEYIGGGKWLLYGDDFRSQWGLSNVNFNGEGKHIVEYTIVNIQKFLQKWLQEQMSKNESLKRGNKMTVEEYKKNRKARLQRLSEALDNLPELTDGKAHIQVDAVTGGAKAEAEDRKKQVKDSFKDKNKETREFIKKQDKDREVDKEEKSENRLMLDESLFNEEVVEKKLNESLYSDAIDVVYDLVDRAKGWIDDGSDKDEAIQQAIDDGLIYSDDIFALARYFGGIDDSTLIESFYESLYELMYEKLGDYGQEEDEEEEDEEQ